MGEMKYDAQLTETKAQLAQARNILIALPQALTVDKLASALSLMLALKQTGKQVSVVSLGTPLVAHGNLYGIGEVTNSLPQGGGGNYVITLEGVVEANGQIPSLEKLDWYPQGANLNLVFHTIPGQKFEPKNITSSSQIPGGFELIFVIGGSSLNDLGTLYPQNGQVFTNAYLVNIDNNPSNAGFGKTNLIDPTAGSISEMMVFILQSLNLNLDADMASNIVAGIYDATANLTVNVKPDSFMAVSLAMQAGAKLPTSTAPPVPTPPQPITAPPQPAPPPSGPEPQPIISSEPQAAPLIQNQGFDLSKVFGMQETFVSPPVVSGGEEKPIGEMARTTPTEGESPAPDWLTPKIFKGGSLG